MITAPARLASPVEHRKVALAAARQEVRDIELAINYLLEVSADFAPTEPVVGVIASPVPPSDDPDTSPVYVECDDCGETFHRNGLGPHRRKHRSDEPTVGDVARFDPDAARARAAAAI